LATAAALTVTGCGGSGPSVPGKTGELSEQHKQQIRDLEAQRQDEWGLKKKKK
jgi:hypothetical protein